MPPPVARLALAPLLIALQLAAASSVCPPEPAPSRSARERAARFASGAVHATHLAEADGGASDLRAPCPCPCRHAAPGAPASRLGPAVLAAAPLLVAPDRHADLAPEPAARARRRAAAPDPVPRAA